MRVIHVVKSQAAQKRERGQLVGNWREEVVIQRKSEDNAFFDVSISQSGA
jgi:hypothetical protein